MVRVISFILIFCLLTKNVELNRRIAGGTVSEKNQFPFFVQIKIIFNSNRQYVACGGSLIHPEWIISAAHCFFLHKNLAEMENNNWLEVYAGTNVRFARNANKNVIRKAYKHPNFYYLEDNKGNAVDIRNDIAVAILQQPYTDVHIRPVYLAQKIQDIEKWTEQCKLGTVVGIGVTQSDTPAYPKNVLYARARPQYNLRVGNQRLNFTAAQKNSTFFTLTSWLNGHVMFGDSGGPFVCYHDDEAVLYGITSLGGQPLNIPGHELLNVGCFERIDVHLDFINEKVPHILTHI